MDYDDNYCCCGEILVERVEGSRLFLKCYGCGREEEVKQ